MDDTTTTLAQLKEMVNTIVREREWEQFHSPKNVSMMIATEAAELMEKFLWVDSAESYKEFEQKKQEVQDEVADVFVALLCLCNRVNIDASSIIVAKLEKNKQKYPIEKAKGNARKYTDF